jgi:hypothetical protein
MNMQIPGERKQQSEAGGGVEHDSHHHQIPNVSTLFLSPT